MAGEFYFESNGLAQAMERSIDATARGMLNAESVDAAPIDTSNLRRQITAEVFTEGDSTGVEITANATRGSRRFNYAYYIHEEDAGGANVNGEKKFLDKPALDNKEKWADWIEREIESELRRAGW